MPEIEINTDTVYLRSNIHQVVDEENETTLWEYDETQLTYSEYFKMFATENEGISSLFSQYQKQVNKALAELSIVVGGK